MRDWFLQTRGMLTGVRLAATEEATSPGAELEVPSRRPHLPGQRCRPLRRGVWKLEGHVKFAGHLPTGVPGLAASQGC